MPETPRPRPAPWRARAVFVGLALLTIAAGLLVQRRGPSLGPVAQDVLGDALWAAMIYWWLGALGPATRRRSRAVVAYAICAAVEFSQLHHTPALDAVRGTRWGHLVLGSGFDPRDFVAYAAGVGVALLLETAAGARRRRGYRKP